MYLLILLFIVIYLTLFRMGYQRLLRLHHLSRKRVIYGLLGVMVGLTLMTAAHWMGYFPQHIASKITMSLYVAVAGFFSGFAIKQFSLKRQAGAIEYIYRSFWTEACPALIGIILIAFGLYRTHLLTFESITGTGVTSGLSLIAFGLLGLTIRVVPEFREKAILILDQHVPWQEVVSYQWHGENILQIEYLNTFKELTDFTTAIPAEDHLIIERLLAKKLKEHEEKRKEKMKQLHRS